MNEEMRALTRRVTGIEVATTRLQAAMAGFSQVLQQANAGAVNCAKCENDISSMKTCAVEECPCGFSDKIEESTSHDGVVAQD